MERDEQPTNLGMALGQLLNSTKYVERQLDQMREDFKHFREEIREEQKSIVERLVKVEQFMWKQAGMVTVASVFFSVAITAIGWYLNK